MPAQKTGPLPRTSTALTLGSAASWKASPMASNSSMLRALRFSGRLRVTSRTPSWMLVRTNSELIAVLLQPALEGGIMGRCAGRVSLEIYDPGPGPEAIVDQQAAAQRIAHPEDQLER